VGGWIPEVDEVNGLASEEAAIYYCGAPVEDAEKSGLVRLSLNAASAFCNTYTGRKLKSRTLTEYYDGGQRWVMVDNYPITTLTAVYDDPGYAFGADTLIPAASLRVTPNDTAHVINYIDSTFQAGMGSVKVIYIGGFLTVPADLENACLAVTKLLYMQSNDKMLGVNSRSIGDGSQGIDLRAVPEWIKSILDGYKRKW
jgi:hypothetical protein